MQKNKTAWSVGAVAIATLALTFTQPTVIHQLVVWIGGIFAVLVLGVLFFVLNSEEKKATAGRDSDQATFLSVTALREFNLGDVAIARMLKLDVDVVSAVPYVKKD